MTQQSNDPTRPDAIDVDAQLRQALEPEPAAVERLVTSALAEHAEAPRSSRPAPARRWQLAVAAAAVAVVAVLALPLLGPRERTGIEVPTARPQNPTATASLRISNEDGPVTVTTTAGSKMVFLPLVLN